MAVNSFYKILIPLGDRREDVAWAKKHYSHLIPVILENTEKSQLPDMRQKMHLVPYNAHVGYFADEIRKMLKLNRTQAIFLFDTNNSKLLQTDTLLSVVYAENKDKEDGALYITYSDRSLGTQSNIAMAANLSFKQQYSLEQRQVRFNLTKQSYPDMIPVILENAENSQYPDMPQKMYLVPKYELVGGFADRIILNFNLNSVLLSTTNNGKVLPRHALMSTVYDLNKDEDGVLYIEYSDILSLGL